MIQDIISKVRSKRQLISNKNPRWDTKQVSDRAFYELAQELKLPLDEVMLEFNQDGMECVVEELK